MWHWCYRKSPSLLSILAILGWVGLTSVKAANIDTSDEEDLRQVFGDQPQIALATGQQMSLNRAPAVASVITAQDIQDSGAIDLDQILKSVPGLHVSNFSSLSTPIYAFRGIYTGYNPQVLLLVNGISINNAYQGNRSEMWGGFPVENISRIEVIRGPGSALYGADAFSGVINIITKTASEISGTELGFRTGNYNTQDAWVQHGGTWGAFETATYLRVGKTDGYNGVIQQDLQKILDNNIGTHASLAPGSINMDRQSVDARADISYNNEWRFRVGYQHRQVGMGAGLADSLDPWSQGQESRLYVDLNYQKRDFAPDWELASVLGYSDAKEKPSNSSYVLFPRGVAGSNFVGAFPEGVLGAPSHSERHTHGSIITGYTGFKQHKFRGGMGFNIEDLYQASEIKNFKILPGPVFQSLGGMTDVTNDATSVFIQPHKRNIHYAFIQDEWTIVRDWTLTAGVRRDQYSDFGGTTNPRLALVWDAAYNLTVKAMHGRAFRAPSFTEQFAINNPVALGNPSLRPERIRTNELAFSWQPTFKIQTALSLFHYRMSDIIGYAPNIDPTTGSTAQNKGSQTGKGFELEGSWEAMRDLKLTGSYSLQHSTDDSTGQDAGLAPHRRLFARADWRLPSNWHVGTTMNYVADRKRQPGDTRPEIPDYTTFDFSVSRENIIDNLNVKATIFNAFNRDAREPSLAPGNIPYDLPLPGRTFYIEFKYKL